MKTLGIDDLRIGAKYEAVIRFKDYSGFFDPDMKRFYLMYRVLYECRIGINYVGFDPEWVITLYDQRSEKGRLIRSNKPRLPFAEEIRRVGALLEKLILLIDPKARVEIDYPEHEELLGRCVEFYNDFWDKYPRERKDEKLGYDIPLKLLMKLGEFLNLVFPDDEYLLGMCYNIWGLKKDILRYGFNYTWQSPAECNTGVFFD